MKNKFFMCVLALIGLGGVSPVSAQLSGQPHFIQRILRIDVATAKPKKVEGGDYDDRLQRIAMRVKFTNLDNKVNIEKCSASIIMFGESLVQRGTIKVLLREETTINLPLRQSMEHACKEVESAFDKDGAIFGFPYAGWAVVVRDSEGKVIMTKSTSPSLEKVPEKIATMTVNGCYNRKFESTRNPDMSYR